VNKGRTRNLEPIRPALFFSASVSPLAAALLFAH
jgi:hypothetical protein